MANKIILKKSSVVGKIPTTGDLDYGEVALNYADGRLYFKTSTNEIDYFNTGINDVVQIANGGTGATTSADAINNLLPVQTAASGQFLTTDGTNVSWAPLTSLLNGYEQLTTTEADQTIDTYDKTIYRTAKYLIQAIAIADVHATEVLITHNDIDVFITEYATIYSSATPLISVTGIIDANNVIVKVTPLNTDTTIDFVRTSLAARVLSIEGDLMSQTGTEDLMTGSGAIDLMD